MTTIDPSLDAGNLPAIKQFVNATKLHPILVDFTAALAPVSVASDIAGRFLKNESLRNTGWWTQSFATFITSFTVVTGWLFWMHDDSGVAGMTIHKWLGTGAVVLLFALFAWRRNLHRKNEWPTTAYFVAGLIFIAALTYQGYLGGKQVFSGM